MAPWKPKRNKHQHPAPLFIYLFYFQSQEQQSGEVIRRGHLQRQGKNTAKKLRRGRRERRNEREGPGEQANECRTGLVDVINNWRSAEAAEEQRTAGTELDASIRYGVTGPVVYKVSKIIKLKVVASFISLIKFQKEFLMRELFSLMQTKSKINQNPK